MDAGYTVRHLHDTRVDRRLESIEKTVSTVLKVIDIWLPNPSYLVTVIILFNSKENFFFGYNCKETLLPINKDFC